MARKIYQTHLVHFRAALLRQAVGGGVGGGGGGAESSCANYGSGKEPGLTHVHDIAQLQMPTNSR